VRKWLQSTLNAALSRDIRASAAGLAAVLFLATLLLTTPVSDAAVGSASAGPSAKVEQVRADFEKLGLEMVGMTTFMGETSAFIRTKPGELPQRFDVGDHIGPYRIISIQNAYVIFENSGVQLWLPLGERDALDDDAPSSSRAASHKAAASELKVKTRNYKTASVVPMNGFLPAARGRAVASSGPVTFMMPMKGVVTSHFGYRKQPIGGARRYHRGVDIAAPYGTPIQAAAAGRVTKVSRSWAKGLNIEIQHAGGYMTAYFHLHKAAVKPGQTVAKGELIAYEGNSGNSTGPHLHFEIHKNGQPVNPALYVRELNGRR
jgi:murein DD-endopeptidase MepM/ murein hydrolase activator NlpD